MALYHIFVLSIVQGFTEFLPISSSGHLVVTSRVFGWPDQGLLIDIAVHVGTLFAVMVYFWRDLWLIGSGILQIFTGGETQGSRLAKQIGIATLPVILVGYLARDYVALFLRDLEIIGWATILFGLLMWFSDRLGMTVRCIKHLNTGHVIFVGVAQVFAFIPGASRSGVTITAGRFIGMERAEAARFAMLLSIPTIFGAGALGLVELGESSSLVIGWDFLIAASMAFVTGLLSIAVMMSWLRKAGLTPFVLYRFALGGALLYFA